MANRARKHYESINKYHEKLKTEEKEQKHEERYFPFHQIPLDPNRDPEVQQTRREMRTIKECLPRPGKYEAKRLRRKGN